MAKKITGILMKDIYIFFRFKIDLKSQYNKKNNEFFYYNKK